jgi:hypothetical protein
MGEIVLQTSQAAGTDLKLSVHLSQAFDMAAQVLSLSSADDLIGVGSGPDVAVRSRTGVRRQAVKSRLVADRPSATRNNRTWNDDNRYSEYFLLGVSDKAKNSGRDDVRGCHRHRAFRRVAIRRGD